MQLRPDRPVHTLNPNPTPVTEVLAPQQLARMACVEAAFIICGAVSDDEVFTSDVLDVAAFILGPEPELLDLEPRDVETGARPGEPGYHLENDPTHQD